MQRGVLAYLETDPRRKLKVFDIRGSNVLPFQGRSSLRDPDIKIWGGLKSV